MVKSVLSHLLVCLAWPLLLVVPASEWSFAAENGDSRYAFNNSRAGYVGYLLLWSGIGLIGMWLARSRGVKGWGYVLAVAGLLWAVEAGRRVFAKRPHVVIDSRQGIRDEMTWYAGWIPWQDVLGGRLFRIGSHPFIVLRVRSWGVVFWIVLWGIGDSALQAFEVIVRAAQTEGRDLQPGRATEQAH
jgi:hypothetical protein